MERCKTCVHWRNQDGWRECMLARSKQVLSVTLLHAYGEKSGLLTDDEFGCVMHKPAIGGVLPDAKDIEIAKLRLALEWYSDPGLYKMPYAWSELYRDCGVKALNALAIDHED